jgi:glucose-1-phosphatase
MIKAIFFDVGNVLVKMDFKSSILKYEKNHSLITESLYKAIHDHQYWKDFTLGKISEKEYFKLVKNNFDGKINVEELKIYIYNDFVLNLELLKYIKELSKDFILGIISNNPQEWFDYCWKNFKGKDIFKIVALSGLLHVRKPDTMIFKYALDQALVKAEETIYIDDREDRVKTPKKLGMNIIIYKSVLDLRCKINKIINKKIWKKLNMNK